MTQSTRLAKPVFGLFLAVFLGFSGQASVAQSSDRAVPIESVTEAAMSAAREVAPGAYFQSAEATYWDDEPLFVLTGVRFNEVWYVYVTHMGVVKEVETETRDD